MPLKPGVRWGCSYGQQLVPLKPGGMGVRLGQGSGVERLVRLEPGGTGCARDVVWVPGDG